MKNKLLITTALVALVSVGNAYAAETVVSEDISGKETSAYKNATGDTLIVRDNITFSDNTTDIAGAAIYNNGTLTIGNGVKFVNNSVYDKKEASSAHSEMGAAIYSEKASGPITIGNNVTFEGNKAGSGAVYLYNGNNMKIGDGIKFISNDFTESFANPKATKTGALSVINGNTVEIGSNAEFSNNKADYGAAIYIQGNGDSVTIGKDTTFSKNSSKFGGAVFNTAGKLILNGAQITENTASTIGGAVVNWTGGEIDLNGNTVFSGNKAGDELNDIHNKGTLNVAGNLTLDGGISGDGTTTFANGSQLTVNAGTTTIANTIVNQGATLNLKLDNGFAGKYEMVTGSLDKEFDIAENNLYKITADEAKAGTYDVAKKSTSEVAAATGANANQAGAIAAVTSGESSNATFNAIANNINSMLQSSNKAEVQAGLDAVTALSPEVAPLVQKTSVETTNQVFNAVGTRLSGGSIRSASEGKASGDNIFERAAVWVQTLFNKSKLDDTSKAKGFDADSTGIAFGAEKFVNDDVKVGVGYAYTDTDIDGFMRNTDVDTHTAIVYGEYKPSNWYVNGIANYSWSDYSENKSVAGVGVKADYDVETFGLQAMTGYDMNVNGVNVTPEAGLRYFHIKQDSYKDSAGNSISSDDADILTGVIGAKVSKDLELENGMNIRPEARVAMTYDLMDDDNNSFVTLANGSAYSVKGETLDRFGMEFGAGVTADLNDNVELSLGYEGKFREDYQDHTGLLNAKYKF